MSNAAAIDRRTFHRGGRTGILLIHGLGGTPVEVRFVAQGLARAGGTLSTGFSRLLTGPDSRNPAVWKP